MPNTNSSFSPLTRSAQFRAQLEKLEKLGHTKIDQGALADFDAETEQIFNNIFGPGPRMEAYEYATMAEAEAVVNMPESAQESLSRDLPQKAIQQRRQVLQGVVNELEAMEKKEEEALTGEDHEDPPGLT